MRRLLQAAVAALLALVIHICNAEEANILWVYDAGGILQASPVLSDTHVYVATFNGDLVAVDITTKEETWTFETQGHVTSTPYVADGVLFVGSYDGYLYAVDAMEGKLRWRFHAGDIIVSSPTVSDGVVFFGSYDYKLYAIDTVTQGVLWTYQTGDKIMGSPVVADDAVYIGSTDQYLYCLDKQDGTLRWKTRLDGLIESAPFVDLHSQRVFIGALDSRFYCLDTRDGQELWRIQLGDKIYSTPYVSGDNVYIGSRDKNVYCVNKKTGWERWRYVTGGYVAGSPIESRGALYIGSADRSVYALNSDDGSEIWKYETFEAVGSTPLISDGVVYVSSYDGRVYGIEANPQACPIDGPWPSVHIGKIVFLSCEQGFNGTISRHCLENAAWGDIDSSNCHEIYCYPTAEEQEEGWTAVRAGEHEAIDCPKGYSGSKSRDCSWDGDFVGLINDCEMIYCEADDVWPRTRAGWRVTIECDEGFHGTRKRTCGWDGVFEPDVDDYCFELFCAKDLTPMPINGTQPTDVEGAELMIEWERTKAGAYAQAYCPDGFVGGPLQRLCSQEGMFGEVFGSCRVPGCDSDGEWPQVSAGVVSELECEDPLIGARKRYCSQDGVYGEVQSFCEEPPEPPILSCQSSGSWPQTTVGNETRLACDDGYTGHLSRVCGEGGVFGPISDVCTLVVVIGVDIDLSDLAEYNTDYNAHKLALRDLNTALAEHKISVWAAGNAPEVEGGSPFNVGTVASYLPIADVGSAGGLDVGNGIRIAFNPAVVTHRALYPSTYFDVAAPENGYVYAEMVMEGWERILALYSPSVIGESITATFREALSERHPGIVVTDHSLPATWSDDPINQTVGAWDTSAAAAHSGLRGGDVQELDVDCVFVFLEDASAEELSTIRTTYSNLTRVPWVVNVKEVDDWLGVHMEGVVVVGDWIAHGEASLKEFRQRFATEFGYLPSTSSYLAYDATMAFEPLVKFAADHNTDEISAADLVQTLETSTTLKSSTGESIWFTDSHMRGGESYYAVLLSQPVGIVGKNVDGVWLNSTTISVNNGTDFTIGGKVAVPTPVVVVEEPEDPEVTPAKLVDSTTTSIPLVVIVCCVLMILHAGVYVALWRRKDTAAKDPASPSATSLQNPSRTFQASPSPIDVASPPSVISPASLRSTTPAPGLSLRDTLSLWHPWAGYNSAMNHLSSRTQGLSLAVARTLASGTIAFSICLAVVFVAGSLDLPVCLGVGVVTGGLVGLIWVRFEYPFKRSSGSITVSVEPWVNADDGHLVKSVDIAALLLIAVGPLVTSVIGISLTTDQAIQWCVAVLGSHLVLMLAVFPALALAHFLLLKTSQLRQERALLQNDRERDRAILAAEGRTIAKMHKEKDVALAMASKSQSQSQEPAAGGGTAGGRPGSLRDSIEKFEQMAQSKSPTQHPEGFRSRSVTNMAVRQNSFAMLPRETSNAIHADSSMVSNDEGDDSTTNARAAGAPVGVSVVE